MDNVRSTLVVGHRLWHQATATLRLGHFILRLLDD
jgi:hypothetical protein